MITDDRLEFSSQWKPQIGPNIGGPVPFVPPDSFTIVPPSPDYSWMEVQIDGPSYTDGLAGLSRPFLDNRGLVSTDLELMTDDNALTVCQAHEVTLRICDKDGYNYNGSFQFNYQKGGMVQIFGVPPNPAWVDTGIVVGKFTPWRPYHVRVNWTFDSSQHIFSNTSFEIDGVHYPIPVALQNIPGEHLNWVPGLYNQLQLDLASKGGNYSVFYRNMANLWL